MKKIYFLVGSQDLYGEETLKQVGQDAHEMSDYLNAHLSRAHLLFFPPMRDAKEIDMALRKANYDPDCIGVLTWMHTFSPAKMWIRGLKNFHKPLLHLHTQYNEELPYNTIDMDFMNLNQSAHGDREFGFITERLGVKREIVVGYYKNENVIKKIQKFIDVALAVDYASTLKVGMLGSNMRDVAVTDGDRVESEIVYGWNANYYGIGDIVDIISELSDDEIQEQIDEYREKYEISAPLSSIREQAKCEVALKKFIEQEGLGALTDTFQDLHGLKQLPGLAIQDLMATGVGFGPEGDYKTSALMATFHKIGKERGGATAFLEDYTYDLKEGKELASHMLEVSPEFAASKPVIEVHPLGIGGKEPPARLVFSSFAGDATATSIVDMGTHFRLISAKIKLIEQPHEMPNLPVARVMWELVPDFETGAKAWIKAGGAHHAVISTSVDLDDIRLFAKLTGTELIVIDENTSLPFGS